jgi:hypothetical protein
VGNALVLQSLRQQFKYFPFTDGNVSHLETPVQ